MTKARKFRGVKAAVGEMPAHPLNNGFYVQVDYDLDRDIVLTDLHVAWGHGSRTYYHDPHIAFVGFYDSHVTMAHLKADILEAIEEEMEYRE